MAEYTEHYNLELPANAEHYDIKVANTNNKIIDEKLYEKVEKIPNKSLSTNDFTNGYKQKLDSLKNYDDTQTKKDISNIQKEQTTQNTNISNIKKEQEVQNTNIEENNSKIVELQTEKAKLETELKEMQEDFYQASIRGQASGEYIHVEDSSNCRSIIGIGGNHEQETREGYNLLDLTSLIGKTETKNGVTYKINEDCSITVNGTPTDYISFNLLDMSLKAGTYKFVDELDNINNVFLQTIGDFQHTSQNNTFSLAEDGKATVYLVILVDAPTLNNATLYPMIYEGTEDKPYEQYGASPSPDYPSEIKTVGSNVNLFNKDNYIKSKLYINKNENKFSEASMGKSFIFDISKYNKLTISKVSSERFGVFASVDYPQKDGVGTYLQDVATKTTSFTYDFTEFNYLVVMYYLTSDTITEQQILDSIKIVEGTETGEYSKFGQGCVKVTKCNKNLAKIDETNWTLTDNIIKNNGRNASFVLTRFKVRKGQKVNLRLKLFSQPAVDTSLMFYIDNAGEPNLSFMGIQKLKLNTTYTKTYIATKDCEISSKMWGNANADIFEFQFWAEIDKTTDYEQHEEQSYIMPVQKEILQGDYFDFDNEEEVHTWNKLVLDGTEDGWLKREVASEECRFEFPLSVVALNNNQTINILCDKLKGLTADATYLKQEGISASTWVQIYLKEFSQNKTVEDFKNWLKEHPLTIYYKLATPNRLKFTDEQKAVAKELNNARTYKNVTNITTDSKAILSLDYAKDQETQNQKMQNEIDEIKQLLSTTQTSAMLLDNLQKEVESEVE